MTVPARLLFASGNRGKLAEVSALAGGVGIAVLSPAEAGWAARVEEDGDTLEANAEKKARAGFAATGLATLADDTGLFVDALDGAPGVRSARYAGPAEDPAANRARLLRELDGVPGERRGAEFRCVLALVGPEGGAAGCRLFRGVCRGTIVEAPRGTGGFGYDSLFQPDGEPLTFAEMPEREKNNMSHRGRAMAAFLDYLKRARETT